MVSLPKSSFSNPSFCFFFLRQQRLRLAEVSWCVGQAGKGFQWRYRPLLSCDWAKGKRPKDTEFIGLLLGSRPSHKYLSNLMFKASLLGFYRWKTKRRRFAQGPRAGARHRMWAQICLNYETMILSHLLILPVWTTLLSFATAHGPACFASHQAFFFVSHTDLDFLPLESVSVPKSESPGMQLSMQILSPKSFGK